MSQKSKNLAWLPSYITGGRFEDLTNRGVEDVGTEEQHGFREVFLPDGWRITATHDGPEHELLVDGEGNRVGEIYMGHDRTSQVPELVLVPVKPS